MEIPGGTSTNSGNCFDPRGSELWQSLVPSPRNQTNITLVQTLRMATAGSGDKSALVTAGQLGLEDGKVGAWQVPLTRQK